MFNKTKAEAVRSPLRSNHAPMAWTRLWRVAMGLTCMSALTLSGCADDVVEYEPDTQDPDGKDPDDNKGEEDAPVCGNGVVEEGEECDDGEANGEPEHCNADCSGTTEPVCGNGIVEEGEACDDGEENGEPGRCHADCSGTPEPVCGNGVVEEGEECDDGNTNTEACEAGEASCEVCAFDCTLQEGVPRSEYRAGLVIDDGDGNVVELCVPVGEDNDLNGTELLATSGLDVVTNGEGQNTAVCAFEGKGCSEAECLTCECMIYPEDCVFWSYFQRQNDAWVYSDVGVGSRDLRHRDLDAWHWAELEMLPDSPYGETPPPVERTFEDVCGEDEGVLPFVALHERGDFALEGNRWVDVAIDIRGENTPVIAVGHIFNVGETAENTHVSIDEWDGNDWVNLHTQVPQFAQIYRTVSFFMDLETLFLGVSLDGFGIDESFSVLNQDVGWAGSYAIVNDGKTAFVIDEDKRIRYLTASGDTSPVYFSTGNDGTDLELITYDYNEGDWNGFTGQDDNFITDRVLSENAFDDLTDVALNIDDDGVYGGWAEAGTVHVRAGDTFEDTIATPIEGGEELTLTRQDGVYYVAVRNGDTVKIYSASETDEAWFTEEEITGLADEVEHIALEVGADDTPWLSVLNADATVSLYVRAHGVWLHATDVAADGDIQRVDLGAGTDPWIIVQTGDKVYVHQAEAFVY